MEKIVWCKDFNVGVSEIDKQHMALIEIVNNLIESVSNNENRLEIIVGAITKMSLYATKHFTFEEQLMQKYSYAAFSLQQEQHKQFRIKIINVSNEVTACEKSVPLELLVEITTYLQNWWLNHILEFDMQYKEFFNKKGIN